MSKPVTLALRRECPDCGNTMYGYPTGNSRMLWHCRDTGEQIGCNARMTSGAMHSARYVDQYQTAKAQMEGADNGQPNRSEQVDPEAGTGDGGSDTAGAGGGGRKRRQRQPDPDPVLG